MIVDFIEKLTNKQQRFCDEYLLDMNACKAALRAGYSAYTAQKGQVMMIPKVKRYIKTRLDAMHREHEVTHNRIAQEIAKIAFGNIGNFFDTAGRLKTANEVSMDDLAAVASMVIRTNSEENSLVEFKMYNKLSALDKLARHTGFYKIKDSTDLKGDFTDKGGSDFTDLQGGEFEIDEEKLELMDKAQKLVEDERMYAEFGKYGTLNHEIYADDPMLEDPDYDHSDYTDFKEDCTDGKKVPVAAAEVKPPLPVGKVTVDINTGKIVADDSIDESFGFGSKLPVDMDAYWAKQEKFAVEQDRLELLRAR